MNVLDLFSGIGGFSLGLERAGMRTVAFCEIDPFCRRVLAKHWPDVPIYDDVRAITGDRLRADGIAVDVICGGFPCQDISVAGCGAGIEGEHSGLWSEYARIIGELRPQYAIVENVAALLNRGMGSVLGDLAALGFDAEWHCIPAAAVGAPHYRDRLWLVAYADSRRQQSEWLEKHSEQQSTSRHLVDRCSEDGWRPRPHVADAGRARLSVSQRDTILGARWGIERRAIAERSRWPVEPGVGRVAYGVPSRVDRLYSLGNAVVPQIPEIIGRAIMTNHGATTMTEAEKLACAKREVTYREHVYPRLVECKRMTAKKAEYELACMKAIVADYEKIVEGTRLI